MSVPDRILPGLVVDKPCWFTWCWPQGMAIATTHLTFRNVPNLGDGGHGGKAVASTCENSDESGIAWSGLTEDVVESHSEKPCL